MTSKLRVAVIHDWLTGMRGGEAVLEGILDLLPDAELFTLVHKKGSVSEKIESRKVHTSFVDRLPFKNRLYRNYLPFFPTAIETFSFRDFDLVVSSSHCVAKGVIVPPGIPHLCYVHSPMRYVWDMTEDYFPLKKPNGKKAGFFNRGIFPYFANYLRTWDSASAHRVDKYICNSKFVGERIRRFYGRDSVVIHPPCVDRVTSAKDIIPSEKRRGDFLVVSALVPYKRIDLAIDAFRIFSKRGESIKLQIVGSGPEEKRLRKMATGNVEFLGNVSREKIQDLYANSRGLIFPGIEDFGIVPVEAQNQGCPVIAYGRGGALETVTEKTGTFFKEQTAEALADAISVSRYRKLKANDFVRSVSRFTTNVFLDKMKAQIDLAVRKSRKGL